MPRGVRMNMHEGHQMRRSIAQYRGDWIIPKNKMIGIVIGYMLLEEYLFILIIPYSILTIYGLLDRKLTPQKSLQRRKHH